MIPLLIGNTFGGLTGHTFLQKLNGKLAQTKGMNVAKDPYGPAVSSCACETGPFVGSRSWTQSSLPGLDLHKNVCPGKKVAKEIGQPRHLEQGCGDV